MKKRSIIIIIVCIVAFVSILIGVRKSEENYKYKVKEGQLVFRMADHQMTEYPSNEGVREFAKLVEERTNGDVKILIYDENALGTEADLVEQVAFGGLDIARVSSIYMSDYVSLMNTFLLPRLFADKNEMIRVLYNEEISIRLKEAYKSEKINILAWYPGSTRGIFYKQSSFEALFKEKIAVPENKMKINEISLLGFLPVPSNEANVNSYLNSNYIEGAEGALLDYYFNKNYEKAGNFTYTPWSIIPEAIIMSNMAIKKLTNEQQEIIREVASETAILISDMTTKKEAIVLKELSNAGIVFYDGSQYMNEDMVDVMKSDMTEADMEWLKLIEKAKSSR